MTGRTMRSAAFLAAFLAMALGLGSLLAGAPAPA